jgi:hypothetical protein
MRLSLLLLLLPIPLLSGCNSHRPPPERLSWAFPAEGVSKLTIRASRAVRASIRHSPKPTITVSGRPTLAANGYHSPDPAGRETSAHEWSFGVTATRDKNAVTLTTSGETIFRQHRYFLDALEIEAPPGVEVIREPLSPIKGAP